jgi:hypothetical protein
MKKADDMPLWVSLAFSSIESRKVALWLVFGCVLFSAYCIPWANYFGSVDWVVKIFLIDDWSWFAMMVPITLWYWLSLKWIDNNSGWEIS